MKPKDRRKKIGHHPGAVVFTGQRKVDKIAIHYLEYNATDCNTQVLDNQSITQFHAPVPELVQWYDIRGIHDTQLIEEFGKVFAVHPLALEDIADIHQRPKLDEFRQGVFIAVQALYFHQATHLLEQEQIAIYLGDNFLLSFQEDHTDLFATVRERIVHHKGRVRTQRADYLAYALLDTVIDQYYLVIDDIERRIEHLEEKIINDPDNAVKADIHLLKQEILTIRRAVAPLREVITAFDRIGNGLISDATNLYIRDLRDHVNQIVELVDTFRDMLNSLQDLYSSEISLRMNNVMKVLTVISTIFIPSVLSSVSMA
ncbi:MAG: magnesium/cobalt transporter CorA [Saprospiraceae bacterium]